MAQPTDPSPSRRARLGSLVIDPSPLRYDRDYRLLWIGQAISGMGRMITQVVLPYQVYVLTGDLLTVGLLSIAFVSAGLSAVDQPARASSIARLVPPERLPAAISLNQVMFNASAIVGPAIGGIVLAVSGIAAAYVLDVVTF